MLPLIKGALMGMAFGLTLYKVGATRYSRVMGMLTLRDTKIMKFAFTAIAVASMGYGLAASLGVAESIGLVPRTMPFMGGAHILGGVLFGAAMGTTGLCPGTCAAKTGGQGGDKKFTGIVSLLALVVGAVTFAAIKDSLLEVGVIAAHQKPLTIYGVLGLPYGPTAIAFGAVILMVILGIDRFTGEKRYEPSAERQSVIDYLRGEWSYTAGGFVAGILVLMATMQNGYLGFSGALLAAVGAGAHLIGVPFSPVPVLNDDIIWRAALILGVIPGGLLARALSTPSLAMKTSPLPKVLDVPALIKTFVAITAMSLGALVGGGCTTGAFISAWPTLSLGSFAMALTFFITSMAVTNTRIWAKSLDLSAAQNIGDRVYD